MTENQKLEEDLARQRSTPLKEFNYYFSVRDKRSPIAFLLIRAASDKVETVQSIADMEDKIESVLVGQSWFDPTGFIVQYSPFTETIAQIGLRGVPLWIRMFNFNKD